jgi:hypothetical protein
LVAKVRPAETCSPSHQYRAWYRLLASFLMVPNGLLRATASLFVPILLGTL